MNKAEPAAGALALQRVRDLRETIHGTLVAIIRDSRPAEGTLTHFEAYWQDAVKRSSLAFSDSHLRTELELESSGLDYPTHALALQAFEFLQTFPIARTRICAGTDCGWLFLDRSKGGQRRWCDMAVCGNLAKSRRHYERKRAARLAPGR